MNKKKLVQNILLIICSSLFSVALAELVLRTMMPVYDYWDRSLLFSSNVFKAYSSGAVRYYPHQLIREVAVYDHKIEYDVVYSTNNYGFIDTQQYRYEARPDKKYYAFVGDSFTAGVNGGAPWVPKLRAVSGGAEIFNLGVGATGFEHFYRLLNDMRGKLHITHIIIVAITDDFFRGYWHPLEIDGKICFCNELFGHTNCQPVPVAGLIPMRASTEEVLRISDKNFREIQSSIKKIRSGFGLVAKMESVLYDESVLYYYTRMLLDKYSRSSKSANIDGALGLLRQVRADYPAAEIHLIHLPQKYEVKTSNYQIDVGRKLEAEGIRYFPALDKCNWSDAMFFPHDGHPNASGYENITRCVSSYLFGQKNDSESRTKE